MCMPKLEYNASSLENQPKSFQMELTYLYPFIG